MPDQLNAGGAGHIDPVTLDELLRMSGDNREFLGELIDTFVDDGRAIIRSMERAAAAGAQAELQRAAHTLKGNATNFGASQLVELNRALEADARGGTVDDPGSRVAEIAREFAAVEAVLLAERERI